MAEKLVGYDALAAIASDIKTDIGTKADASTTYNKTEVDTALSAKADKSDTYTKAQVDSAVGAKADASSVYTKTQTDNLLDEKANTSGEYDNLVVGNAKQLVSKITETDKVPYLFRTSGGSIDIGDRETDKLVGGTVAFNQLVTNPTQVLSFTANASAEKNIQTGISFVANRVYYASYRQKDTMTSNSRNTLIYNDGSANTQSTQNNRNLASGYYFWIFKPQNTATGTLSLWCHTPDVNVDYDNFNLIDLTAFFGSSTIADYVYSLEQGTAGAGVAWLKAYAPKIFGKYNAYNAGVLKSVQTSKHITTGFNQWDEEWELGGMNYNCVNSKNLIKIMPNTTYRCTYKGTNTQVNSTYANYFDVNGDIIEEYSSPTGVRLSSANGTFTTPSNAYYLKFRMQTYYGTTYNHDICINLSWDGERDGEYEPYVKHEYDLSGSRLVHRVFGIVDLGTLNYTNMETSDKGFYSEVQTMKSNIVFAKYSVVSGSDIYNGTAPDKTIGLTGSGTSYRIRIKDTSFSANTAGANALKASLSGQYLVYELAEPFDETVSNPELRGIPMLDSNNKLYYYGDTCDDFTNPQIVDDFGTEEYVDTREIPIPVGHETEYQPNLRAKLEMSPDSPGGDGDYIVRQTSGVNEYVALTKELPALPSATDGTYTLKCTVASGTATLSWVADE